MRLSAGAGTVRLAALTTLFINGSFYHGTAIQEAGQQSLDLDGKPAERLPYMAESIRFYLHVVYIYNMQTGA
jgi:hypothetical protein